MQRSGFWIRLAATAIDGVVMLVFFAAIAVTASVLDARGQLTEAKERGLWAMLLALWIAYSGMEALIGATVGKLLVGIVIALPDGAPAASWTRVLRWSTKQSGWLLALAYILSGNVVAYYVSGLLNFILCIGFLRALGEDKQAWHDVWSHTAVVPRARAARMREVHEEPVGPPTPT